MNIIDRIKNALSGLESAQTTLESIQSLSNDFDGEYAIEKILDIEYDATLSTQQNRDMEKTLQTAFESIGGNEREYHDEINNVVYTVERVLQDFVESNMEKQQGELQKLQEQIRLLQKQIDDSSLADVQLDLDLASDLEWRKLGVIRDGYEVSKQEMERLFASGMYVPITTGASKNKCNSTPGTTPAKTTRTRKTK